MAVQVLSLHHCLKNFPTTHQIPLSPLIIYRPKTKNPNPCPNRHAIQAQPNCWKQQKPSRTNNINSLPAKNQRGREMIRPAALAPKVNCAAPQKVQEFMFYAGSCSSSASPPPSSLPVPSFLAKK